MTLQQAQIDCAISIARLSLFGKLDKQGKPLFDHVCRVADRAIVRGLSHEQILASYLHETIEDTDVDAKAIETLFGRHVLLLIALLSRPQNWTYKYYITQVSLDQYATEIKLCDLEDNLDPSRGPIPESLRTRYIEAKEYLEKTLADHCRVQYTLSI